MRTRSRLVALAAALALVAPSLPASGQSPTAAPTKAQQQEASTRFMKGIELFKDGDYQAALIELRRAYDLAPNFNVLYNIGQVYFQLQDYPGALNTLTRYLSEGGSHVPASRRADVLKDIEKLTARVAHLEIATTVADAEITIDDVSVGKSPLPAPVMVSAGRHRVTVSKTGFTATTKVVEVAGGDATKVPIEPVEQKAAPVVAPPEPLKAPERPVPENPPPPPPPARSVPVAGILVTSGLTVGAVVTGLLALNASSTLKSDRASANATHDQLSGDATRTRALGIASDVLTGGAVVALVTTLVVGLRTPSSPPATARAPQLLVGPGGVGLAGTF